MDTSLTNCFFGGWSNCMQGLIFFLVNIAWKKRNYHSTEILRFWEINPGSNSGYQLIPVNLTLDSCVKWDQRCTMYLHIWTRGPKNLMKTCSSISWNQMLGLKGSLSIFSYHMFHHIHSQNWIRFFLTHQDWISLCPYCFYMAWFTICITKVSDRYTFHITILFLSEQNARKNHHRQIF